MKLNKEYIEKLCVENGWSQNELSRQIRVPKGTISNALSGRRGIGRKLLSRLLQVFPDESSASLIFDERRLTI